jgi:hypothetical protein
LKKREVVKLFNANQFYFITIECLLTMSIKHHDATSCQQQSPLIISPWIALSTYEQFEQCFALATSVFGVQSEDVQIQPTTNLAIENL